MVYRASYEKISKYLLVPDKGANIFDYLYESSMQIKNQMREERELVIFIQEVFLGKYKSLMDESMEYIMNKARNLGEDIVDEPFEEYEKKLKAMIELMKNGIVGTKV